MELWPAEKPRTPAEGFPGVLDDIVTVMGRARIPYVIGGGVAAMAYGLRQTTSDIDIFVQPEYAMPAKSAFAEAGYHTWIEDPHWLYKAVAPFAPEVDVDIIFESKGNIHVVEGTLCRARTMEVEGRSLPIMPPEDFFVIKAVVANPETPRHFRDAIAILKRQTIDWEWVIDRTDGWARQVLVALTKATEDGADVPGEVYAALLKRWLRIG